MRWLFLLLLLLGALGAKCVSIRRWCNRVTFPLAGAMLFDRARPVIDILELVVTTRCLSLAWF